MTTITLDVSLFRQRFATFADDVKYPDSTLDVQWIMACQYVSPEVCGSMTEDARTLALQLMLAHLLALGSVISAGGTGTGTPGISTGATVDKVAVSLASPPFGTSQWKYWLSLTPYGQQLLTLLAAQAAGGWYIGGLPERAAFRKVGGVF